MLEFVLPNLQQVAPAWEDGHQVHPFQWPEMSRWIVPQDDTHTMFIEFRHVSETAGVTPGMVGGSERYAAGPAPRKRLL